MKKLINFILVFNFLIINAQVVTFSNKKPLGNDLTSRNRPSIIAYNGDLYILGGTSKNGSPYDLTKYNIATGSITKLKNIDQPVTGCAFLIQNKIYIINGSYIKNYNIDTDTWSNNIFFSTLNNFDADCGFVINETIYICSKNNKDVCSFNTTNGIKSQKASFNGQNGRFGAFAFEINGKGYTGGGGYVGINSYLDSFQEYNPLTDQWTLKTNLPHSSLQGVGVGINGKGYFGTGFANLNQSERYKSYYWYEFDPLLNTWTSKQNFMNLNVPLTLNNLGKANCGIATSGNDIYLFGGNKQNGLYDDCLHKFNVLTNTWELINSDLGQNRTAAFGFSFNDKVYVGGGEDGEDLNDFWEYNITSDTWTKKADMPIFHRQRSVVEVNGKGYFLGGFSDNIITTTTDPFANYSDQLHQYDPTSNTWVTKQPFPGGKRAKMVSFAYNNKIYAGGGRNQNGIPISDFYEYDTTNDTWLLKTSVPFASLYSSHFLIGNIGYILTDNPSQSLIKYNFDNDTWTSEFASKGFSDYENNSDFSYNGLGYHLFGYSNAEDWLSCYNPQTNSWITTVNMPFKRIGQTIIPATNGVYFGFGGNYPNNLNKIGRVNEWRFLNLNPTVSDKYGTFYSEVEKGEGTPVNCSTGTLFTNSIHVVNDLNGGLFTSVIGGNFTSIPKCYSIKSEDLAIPFKTATRNFGTVNIIETAMFLNKSVNTEVLNTNVKLRLYYNSFELNKLVSDFNLSFGTNKTIADIKIIRYYDNISNPSDHNPLNNLNGTYNILNAVVGNIGTDKYFELSSQIYGEIYAVLTTTQPLVNTVFDKNAINIYPNPSNKLINIDLKDNYTINRVVISDITGKIVFSQNNNDKIINIENFSNGMYFIEINCEEKKLTYKFLKN